MAGKDYLVVIVIDIRSAFSRYVYKFRTDSSERSDKNYSLSAMEK